MPRWSESDLHDYLRKRQQSKRPLNLGDPLPSPIPEPPVCAGPLAEAQGKASHPGRCIVRITACRVRTLDSDNCCPKYFIDSLRYAGILHDDRPEDIELQVKQEKVAHKKDQKTIIEIIPLP
jgi:hypothetical protein